MKEIIRDGNLIAYDNGIVYDTKTYLEWFAGHDEDTTWDKAKSWANSLSVDSGGWQMPNLEELKSLYNKGAGARNMTPLLKTTGQWIWSCVPKETAAAWIFDDGLGESYWGYRYSSSNSRVFAVRFQKK